MDESAPPPQYEEATEEDARHARRVRVVVCMDMSGSMDESTSAAGQEVLYSKREVAIQATKFLATIADEIGVVLYANQSHTLLPLRSATTAEDVQAAFDSDFTNGGTNIEAGLLHAKTLLAAAPANGSVNVVVLLTDGLPNVGKSTTEGLCSVVRTIPNAVVCTVGFGKGDSIDPAMLHQMAAAGGGVYVNVPDVTSLGTGMASIVAMARSWELPPPADAPLAPRAVTDALSDALLGLVQTADPFSDRDARVQAALEPFVATVSGFATDLENEILPGFSDPVKYREWGKAYLLAISLAYRRRVAITHFDKGLAPFRDHNPVARSCYRAYSDMYDNMPPPIPHPVLGSNSFGRLRSGLGVAAMVSFNNPNGGCVDGETLLVGVLRLFKAKDVKVGDVLAGGTVTHILESRPNDSVTFKKLSEYALITPWHPVIQDTFSNVHVFPANVDAYPTVTKHCTLLRTFELSKDGRQAPHFFCFCDNLPAVAALALNAGIGRDPVANHAFWGTTQWRDTHPDPGPVYQYLPVVRAHANKGGVGKTERWA